MLFYATGIIPFSLFSTMSKGVARRDHHQPRAAELSGGHRARRGVRQVHPQLHHHLMVAALLLTGIILFSGCT